MRSARASFFCSFLVPCWHSARVPVEATWQGSCVQGLRVVFWVPRFWENAKPFAVLSSGYFGDAVTDHVSRGSVFFPKALRKVLPENPLNTDTSTRTLRHT